MSLLSKVKESLKKQEEVDETSSEEESNDIEDHFEFYEKKWVLAPHMDEILQGNLELIPVECLFTHYILRYEYHCLYIALDDHETGDDFEIYEFDWIGEYDNPEEKIEPEFKTVESSLTAIECGKFLADRIKEGYKIYIQERKEFGDD